MSKSDAGRGGLAEWDDPQVQIVYALLCGSGMPSNTKEHWEGYMARKIVSAIRSTPSREEIVEECASVALACGENAAEAAKAKDAYDYIAGYQDCAVDANEAIRSLKGSK